LGKRNTNEEGFVMKKQKAWVKTSTGKSGKPISEFEKQQIATDLTLPDCLIMMKEIPTLQPIG